MIKIIRKSKFDEMTEKIDSLREHAQEVNLKAVKHKNIIDNIIFVINHYNNGKCGGTKLISNISYLLGLGDIPDKYKIIKVKERKK